MSNFFLRTCGSSYTWTPESDALLGTIPDQKLARQLGIATSTVVSRRKKLGVAVWSATNKRLQSKPYIDWIRIDHYLGTMSDERVANMFGISTPAVYQRRKAKQIPSLREKSRIDWNSVPLGAESDSELGRQLGVSYGTVRHERIKRNIPTYVSKKHGRSAL